MEATRPDINRHNGKRPILTRKLLSGKLLYDTLTGQSFLLILLMKPARQFW